MHLIHVPLRSDRLGIKRAKERVLLEIEWNTAWYDWIKETGLSWQQYKTGLLLLMAETVAPLTDGKRFTWFWARRLLYSAIIPSLPAKRKSLISGYPFSGCRNVSYKQQFHVGLINVHCMILDIQNAFFSTWSCIAEGKSTETETNRSGTE